MSILIGGDAGQGVESSGAGFSKAFARAGLHVFGMQDYRSRIRGGHNFYQIRLAGSPRLSHSSSIQMLLALTQDSVERHLEDIVEGGVVIVPERLQIDEEPLRKRGIQVAALPLIRIAEEHGGRVMTNTAALGAAAGIAEFPLEYMETVIRENFGRRGQEAVDSNLKVAEIAHDMARQRFASDFPYKLKPIPGAPKRMLITGNQALALGAVVGGCRFMSAYPMTPATTIIEWLSALPREYGVVTKHAEDEIAAAGMALGASYAGARAMTATSGGGFCLMVEMLSLAGMTEVPLVVAEVQRAGPATGLPTRTEQGDLLFAINAGHGDFLRIVLAPGTIEECFEAGWRAFNLAEKYQCPVIVLSDQFLASSVRTLEMDSFDFASVKIERGSTLTYDDLDRLTNGYNRFEFSEMGISPRAIPGHPKAVFTTASDEHAVDGHFSDEGSETRRRMMQKRMRKLEEAQQEMRPPSLYGPEEAELTLLCWGSTYGPCKEAVDEINAAGGSANVLEFADLWPMSAEAARALGTCKQPVVVEQNYTSQLARLLRMTTGIEVDRTLNKYDGRPFTPEEIIAGLGKEVVSGYKA